MLFHMHLFGDNCVSNCELTFFWLQTDDMCFKQFHKRIWVNGALSILSSIFYPFVYFHLFTGNMNFLTADGTKFTHPLHHLGKTPKDLPVIAIDSFRHMYLFPNIADVPWVSWQSFSDIIIFQDFNNNNNYSAYTAPNTYFVRSL